MKEKYLIFGNYPTSENIKDGMFQRIKAIDDELMDYHRIYVTISLFNFRKRKIIVNPLVTVYSLNFFIHYFFMLILLRNVDAVYFHSIFNYKYAIFYPIRWVKNRFIDFHGAVPEEYQFLVGNNFRYRLLCLFEQSAVKKCNILVCVSHNMRNHFLEKYHYSKGKRFLIKPIAPINSLNRKEFYPEVFKKEKGIDEDAIIIIYSGNLQKWQNFDLMVDCIKKTEGLNYLYIILTGEKEEAIKRLHTCCCNMNNVILDSVFPEELYKYYSIAHYGFLLRDDHVLNEVAAPTKLTEYLYYGIVPILKFEEIGDRAFYHYEYILYNSDAMMNLRPYKSELNQKIALDILDLSANTSVKI